MAEDPASGILEKALRPERRSRVRRKYACLLGVEVRRPDRGAVGHRAAESGAGQVRLTEIGASKIGEIESRAVKTSAGEVCGGQIGRAQIGSIQPSLPPDRVSEVGLMQVCADEHGAHEPGAGEVGAAKVR